MPIRICIVCGDRKEVQCIRLRCRSCASARPRNRKRKETRYRMITINKKRVYYHRYIMEQYLGRKLKREEIVHHLDGNIQNNSINNLELLSSQAEHLKTHNIPRDTLTGKFIKENNYAHI